MLICGFLSQYAVDRDPYEQSSGPFSEFKTTDLAHRTTVNKTVYKFLSSDTASFPFSIYLLNSLV